MCEEVEQAGLAGVCKTDVELRMAPPRHEQEQDENAEEVEGEVDGADDAVLGPRGEHLDGREGHDRRPELQVCRDRVFEVSGVETAEQATLGLVERRREGASEHHEQGTEHKVRQHVSGTGVLYTKSKCKLTKKTE